MSELGRYPHKKHQQGWNSKTFESEFIEDQNKVDLKTSEERINVVGTLTVNDAEIATLSNLSAFTFNIDSSVSDILFTNGTIVRYNTDLDVLEIVYANGQIQQISREDTYFLYLPEDADPMPNGTPFYFGDIDGAEGGVQTMVPYVASNTNIATAFVKGVTTIDIEPGSYGIGVRRGRLTVEGHGLTPKGRFWLADGVFTQEPPTAPNLNVECGIVIDEDTLFIYPCILSPIANTTAFSSSSLFMTNTDSDIAGYKLLGDLEEAETTKTITANSGTSPVEGDKYLSEPLGITSLPTGVIQMAGVVKVDSSVGTTTLTVSVSLYHEDESTTLIADDISPDINNTADESIRFSVPFTAISTIEPTDRLLVETMLTVSTATDKTFTYYTGGGKGAYITIPLPLGHTDLVKLNDDPNFQHLTTEQVSLVDNSMQKVTSTDNAIVRFDGITGAIQNSSVFIDDDGSVGIGTETPLSELGIYGTTPAITLQRGTITSSSDWQIKNNVHFQISQGYDTATPNAWKDPYFHITYDTGNVGIGTTTPSEKLDVVGNIKASGDSASVTKTIDSAVQMSYDSVTEELKFTFI